MMMVPNQGMVAGNMTTGSGGAFTSFNFNYLLSLIFNLAMDFFAILLVVAQIGWVVSYIKLGLSGSGNFGLASWGNRCKCGQRLEHDWTRCPVCGEATAINNGPDPKTQTV